MSAQTAITKLFIPPTRKSLVHRARLMERLHQGMDGKLTIVSGPAGFGKTTLLSKWVTESKHPVGWVSLDERDNDWHRFVSLLVQGLQNISDEIANGMTEMLYSTKPQESDALITYLINQIAEFQAPFSLVLDDYHVITEASIHELMQTILESQLPHMHLLISTRSDPPWPLARWRVRGEFSEIRAQDLRFSLDESTQFLNETMGLGLSQQHIEQLENRIEGWAAGLQMAALSIQNRADITSFIQNFTGSHRYVFDYLMDEVFYRLPPYIQDFLLTTSMLERMCAELCDHVRNAQDSQQILEQLDQMNLFVIPLDDHRSWYRYHHLFGELVQQIAHQKIPQQIHGCYRRAREWYQSKGLVNESIHYGIAEGNFDQVAELIEKNFLAILEHREWIALTRWLDALPDDIIQSRPWINMAYAYLLFLTGSTRAIDPLLQQAERALNQIDELESRKIRSYCAYIRAELTARTGDITGAIEYARKSLEHSHPDDKWLRCSIASIFGAALQRRGDFKAAAEVFADGITAGQTIGDSNAVIYLYGDLIGLFVEQGDLRQAHAYCQEALQFIEANYQKRGRYTPGAAHIYFRLSTILRHWNDLEGSLRYAQFSDEILSKWGIQYRLNFVNLAIAQHVVGDYAKAHQTLDAAAQIAQRQSNYWVENVKTTRVSFWLTEGNLEAASQWASGKAWDPQAGMEYKDQLVYRTLAQVYLTQGQAGDSQVLQKAIGLLTNLEKMYGISGAAAYLLQTLILQALAFQADGEPDQALDALRKALSLGEKGGYIRVFVREGQPLQKLLQRVIASGGKTPYIEKLLNAFSNQPESTIKIDPDLLIEPLTDRELEILRCLDSEMIIPEIAASLVISVATARTHIKRIYRKLDVHSRFEALTKAKELNLL